MKFHQTYPSGRILLAGKIISIICSFHNTVYREIKFLAPIQFGKMARNRLDEYLANLKFDRSHNQIESYDVSTTLCMHLQSSRCQIAEDGDVRG